MQSYSTSFHKLSADGKISKWQHILWIIFNLLNNSFSKVQVDNRIKEYNYSLAKDVLENIWNDISINASPSRRLCDLFWNTLPWGNIKKELTMARVLEVGCGTGIYGQLIERLLNEAFDKYVGVDVEENKEWAVFSQNPKYIFHVGRGGDVDKYLSNSNFIVTQSALEHFEEDLSYFRKIATYISYNTQPVLQIHLIPSASCITTYPWHGIREYTPRTIAKITKLFGRETQYYLISLGGVECNKLHRKYITWPNIRSEIDLRYKNNHKYQELLRTAVLKDFKGKSASPAFYALVMASNFKKDLCFEWNA